MMYITEPFYFNKPKAGFDFSKILLVTAKTIGSRCDWYEAQIMMPKPGVSETEKSGMLPEDSSEKHVFIANLIEWILNNSETADLFKLNMDANPIGERHKFEHHDDTCCWYLNLSPQEFTALQKSLKENSLPEDLFYPADNALRLLKPLGFFGKLMTGLKFTWQSFELFSPKQWEEELKKHPESIKKLSRHIPQ